jgi:hypothetical protein
MKKEKEKGIDGKKGEQSGSGTCEMSGYLVVFVDGSFVGSVLVQLDRNAIK